MPYIITEPCIGVKDASCVDVCPVDCIITTDADEMFYIDPVTCIDCSYCVSVCPVNAIFDEFAVPAEWRDYIRKNRGILQEVTPPPADSRLTTRLFLSAKHTPPLSQT